MVIASLIAEAILIIPNGVLQHILVHVIMEVQAAPRVQIHAIQVQTNAIQHANQMINSVMEQIQLKYAIQAVQDGNILIVLMDAIQQEKYAMTASLIRLNAIHNHKQQEQNAIQTAQDGDLIQPAQVMKNVKDKDNVFL